MWCGDVNSPVQGYMLPKWLNQKLSLGSLTPELYLKQKGFSKDTKLTDL